MNLTFGDLIIVEISLIHYLKDLDLSMQSGQYMSELLGKIEYELTQLKEAAVTQLPGSALLPPSA
jgi:hypothetical protein